MSRYIEVKRSSIHGRGAFAVVDIPAGVKIGRYEGDRTDTNGAYVLWVTFEDGTETGIKGRNELRFVNHCSRPNCEFDGQDLYALQKIDAGSELTLHYGDEWE